MAPAAVASVPFRVSLTSVMATFAARLITTRHFFTASGMPSTETICTSSLYLAPFPPVERPSLLRPNFLNILS